jgi:hypothetical protein
MASVSPIFGIPHPCLGFKQGRSTLALTDFETGWIEVERVYWQSDVACIKSNILFIKK